MDTIQDKILQEEQDRYYINCPYAEKEEAKALGARWDPRERKWYYTDKSKTEAFRKWLSGEKSRVPAVLTAKEEEYRMPALEPVIFKKLRLKDFVIIDTETTGLLEDDEIVEFSAMDSNGRELYHSMFRPEKQIHWSAAKVTGISNKMLADAPLFWQEWDTIKKCMEGRIVIAHNTSFDYRLTRQTAMRYGLDVREVDRMFKGCLDSMEIAKRHIRSKSYKLSTLCRKLGIEDEQKHRAASDCLMVLKLLRKIESLPET